MDDYMVPMTIEEAFKVFEQEATEESIEYLELSVEEAVKIIEQD